MIFDSSIRFGRSLNPILIKEVITKTVNRFSAILDEKQIVVGGVARVESSVDIRKARRK